MNMPRNSSRGLVLQPGDHTCAAGVAGPDAGTAERGAAPQDSPSSKTADGGVDQKSMPPMPPVGSAAPAFSFSGLSATTASVVRNRPAMEAAFCSAERVTL